MGRRRTAWLLLGAALLATAAGALALRGGARGDPATTPREAVLEFSAADFVRLSRRPLAAELILPGSVQATAQATVRAKLAAEVRRVLVREGERVRAGQVLVEFDTAALRVQRAERLAALAAARAQWEQGARAREANAQLVKQNFISHNAFDAADAALQSQAAAVEVAQAQLAHTELLLADAVVRAPIGGLVARRHVQPGEKVGADAPLLAIVDLDRLEVVAQAPVSDVAQIALSARAEIAVEGLPERVFEGQVERINPSADPGSRSIKVYVSLRDPGGLLRAGMFARVRLRVGSETPLAVLPLGALREANGEDEVWLLADGRLRRQTVLAGRRDSRGQWVEIRSGLSGDEQVLATRFDHLRDGVAARIVDGGADAQPATGRPAARAD
jgi:RND family efflux transporter MFP subunit